MKLSSALLVSALAAIPCAASPGNPWTQWAHYEKLKYDIHGNDYPGPPLSDVAQLGDYWAQRSTENAKSDGGVDANPKIQNPQTWGGNGKHLFASVYGDACAATGGDASDSPRWIMSAIHS